MGGKNRGSLLLAAILILAPGTQMAVGQNQNESKSTQSMDIPKINAIGVTIGGGFPVNGTFPASPMERLDQFITRQYATVIDLAVRRPAVLSNNRYDQSSPSPLPEYPKRGIRLKRANGTEVAIDLERFRLTGDFAFNPYLLSDDVVIFPDVDARYDFVSISGAVNKTLRFQYVNGDRLATALLFSGGFRPEAAGALQVTISRLDSTGQVEEKIVAMVADNPLLKRGDRIWVAPPDNERRDFHVSVSGEVNNPGWIPITKSSTTVREVIERAGGFKPSADRWRAELIRGTNVFQSLFFTEQFEDLMMLRSADISTEDSLVFAIDNRLRFQRGNGLVDFTRLDSASGDFVVRDGDFIFVPERQNLVYVFGQVASPGYVRYVAGQTHLQYIQSAGGMTPTAKDEVYLISGKSRAWSKLDEGTKTAIEPGDYIWVAKTPRRPVDFWLTRLGAFAQIVGAAATLVLLFKQF